MQAIIEACRDGRIPDSAVVAVIGTRDDAPALQRAHMLGVATAVVNPREFPEPEMYGDALLWVLQKAQPDLICLAGYMRLLPAQVVQAYPMRIMNIHPALLPLFGGKGMYGLKVHQAVLESGMKVTGCTVHFVMSSTIRVPSSCSDVCPFWTTTRPKRSPRACCLWNTRPISRRYGSSCRASCAWRAGASKWANKDGVSYGRTDGRAGTR
jgi:hypothetical protein